MFSLFLCILDYLKLCFSSFCFTYFSFYDIFPFNKGINILDTSKTYIVNLTKHLDKRGNLSIIEEMKDIPFEIKRAFWIYDVPGGETRGGHAYRETEEFIVALSGSFDVVIDDGREKKTYSLNRSYYGLYVPKMMWRQMVNFSTNSLALVLTSTDYDDSDYIREYETFIKEKSNEKE